MVNRITITLPPPLAEAIAARAAENLRSAKAEVLWLLREAVRASTVEERQSTTRLVKERASVRQA